MGQLPKISTLLLPVTESDRKWICHIRKPHSPVSGRWQILCRSRQNLTLRHRAVEKNTDKYLPQFYLLYQNKINTLSWSEWEKRVSRGKTYFLRSFMIYGNIIFWNFDQSFPNNLNIKPTYAFELESTLCPYNNSVFVYIFVGLQIKIESLS